MAVNKYRNTSTCFGNIKFIKSWRGRAVTTICMVLVFCVCAHAQKSNVQVNEGNEAYKNGDFTTAIKAYLKALQTSEKNDVAKFNLGNALNKNKEADKAEERYDDAINSSQNNSLKAGAYYNKALALLQQKKLQQAIDAFKQSLRMAPADNDARENLQKALNELKQQQQQNQPQQPNKNKQPQDNKKQNKKQQPKMDRQTMEQKFNELRNQEKELQKQLQKQNGNPQDQEKDW